MNDTDPVDLSPLDPRADAARWERVVSATMARVDAAVAERERRHDPLTLIAAWRQPLLVAASVALALLVPLEMALELRETRVEQVAALVKLSWSVDRAESQPSAADFLRALAAEQPR